MAAVPGASGASSGWRASYTAAYQPAPSDDPGAQPDPGLFTTVSAVSPTDVFAAGYTYPDHDYFNDGVPTIEHWDGAAWSRWHDDSLPTDAQAGKVNGIAARSTSDVWLTEPAGDPHNVPVIVHWDGTAWSDITNRGLPPYSSGQLILDRKTTWIVGSGFRAGIGPYPTDSEAFIATYVDGSSPHWVTKRYARSGSFIAGDVRNDHDAWVIGKASAGDFDAKGQLLIERWNGTTWRRMRPPKSLDPVDVAVASRKSVMVIGAKNSSNGATRGVVWNGHRWRDVGRPKAKPDLWAVTTDPRGGFWTSGTGRGDRTSYYRSAHGHWTHAKGPARTFSGVSKQAVRVNAMDAAGDSVWAAGVHSGFNGSCREGCADSIAGAPIVDRVVS
jgi:hypothetical protein